VVAVILVLLVGAGVGVTVAVRARPTRISPDSDPRQDRARKPPALKSNALLPVPGDEVRTALLGPRRLIVEGTATGRVRVLVAGEDRVQADFATDGAAIAALAISDDESTVAAATRKHSLWVWNVESRAMHSFRPTSTDTDWGALAISPDGRLVAAAEFDVEVYDVRTQKLARTLVQPEGEHGRGTYNALAFSADSTVVAGVSNDGAQAWELSTGRQSSPAIRCDCGADGSALSRDARFASFGTSDGHVLLWDMRTGRQRADHTVALAHVYASAVTVDGSRVIVGNAEGLVAVWDASSNTTVAQTQFREGPVTDAQLFEDGSHYLVSVQVEEPPAAPTTCNFTGCGVHHQFFLLTVGQ